VVACGGETAGEAPGPAAGWPSYGGDAGGLRWSPLDGIDRENVAALEVAWTFHTGDVDPTGGRHTAFEATPVLHGDTLYFCSPYDRIFALDAETGVQRWVYDPGVDLDAVASLTCRGVAVAEVEAHARTAPCRTTVFEGTVDARLVAVDAGSGHACEEFGNAGEVDLTRGLGDVRPREYKVTSPPTVVHDVVVVGAQVSDNKRLDAPGGVVRAYDTRTGTLRWAFDPIAPGTPPLPPGPDGPRFHRGTPNAWSIFSADPERGLVFVPTGNPSNDFYRGGRGHIDYYGSSVVALHAESGEVAWHFQTVHHDLWDYDVSSQPTLVDLPYAGREVPALVQATKVGHLFVLDRETGVPLHPVEERPVPVSDVPGEQSSPTQPFPTLPPPLHAESFGPDDIFALPVHRASCRERLGALRYEGMFTPPSLRGSLEYPGVAGGANWGGIAVDPERRIAVVSQTRLAVVQRLVPRAQQASTPSNPPNEILFPQEGTDYAVLQSVLLSSLGIPCSPPPWATLLAVDLDDGRILWEVPFGTTRGQAPWPFWMELGVPAMGGPIVTAGGVVFIGASMDGYLRAYDLDTGSELWRDALPAVGQATPMTYRLRDGGRQFVVIAAGGHATLGTKLGDAVVAYALPR